MDYRTESDCNLSMDKTRSQLSITFILKINDCNSIHCRIQLHLLDDILNGCQTINRLGKFDFVYIYLFCNRYKSPNCPIR